jgi:hypothetical protein
VTKAKIRDATTFEISVAMGKFVVVNVPISKLIPYRIRLPIPPPTNTNTAFMTPI